MLSLSFLASASPYVTFTVDPFSDSTKILQQDLSLRSESVTHSFAIMGGVRKEYLSLSPTSGANSILGFSANNGTLDAQSTANSTGWIAWEYPFTGLETPLDFTIGEGNAFTFQAGSSFGHGATMIFEIVTAPNHHESFMCRHLVAISESENFVAYSVRFEQFMERCNFTQVVSLAIAIHFSGLFAIRITPIQVTSN
jgi:hypothetical protein